MQEEGQAGSESGGALSGAANHRRLLGESAASGQPAPWQRWTVVPSKDPEPNLPRVSDWS